jgi:DNA modification methylase
VQVEQIAASISEFGFNNPILVDTKAGIIAGHGRLEEHLRLGLRALQVPARANFLCARDWREGFVVRRQVAIYVVNEKKPAANRIHPTAKPIELIERALLNSSKSGDVVADVFGGSGSTLIACERRNRKARLMEIDPKYADCIVLRFQEYTGKHAVLDGGNAFDEVALERAGAAA